MFDSGLEPLMLARLYNVLGESKNFQHLFGILCVPFIFKWHKNQFTFLAVSRLAESIVKLLFRFVPEATDFSTHHLLNLDNLLESVVD